MIRNIKVKIANQIRDFILNKFTVKNIQVTNSYCDLKIAENPFWNHIIENDQILIKKLRDILNNGLIAMSFHEVVNLYRMVLRTNHLTGDIAEVGTFHGGSALVMALANQMNRKMHLFDTFSGIPESTEGIDQVNVGDIKGNSLDQVKSLLKNFNHNINYHVGIFPETTSDISNTTTFSLVNLDMDVYQSTKLGFEYFYPRMNRGGIIICHDYFSQTCPGVKQAVDEFFIDKPETLIDLWHTQVAMVKF
ncbi:TylF/MycF/NovP-related O-methyltransferase [Pigmentibacter ruber]